MTRSARQAATTARMRRVEHARGAPIDTILRERYAALGSVARVAAELGLTDRAAHDWYRRRGIPVDRRARTTLRELRALGLAGTHRTLHDLAVALRPNLARAR